LFLFNWFSDSLSEVYQQKNAKQQPMTRPTELFKNLTVGSTARVKSFNTLDKTYRNRLMSLGLTPGTEFKIQHVAPFGDPVDIRVRGYHLSLRWGEVGDMEVECL
jgi:ferrous iron transport protein A